MKKSLILLPVLLAFFLYACDESVVNSEDCPKNWVLSNFQNINISIGNGSMYLSSSGLNSFVPPTVLQYNDTISGDFEVIIEFQDLLIQSPGTGFFAGVIVNALNQSNSNYISSTVNTNSPLGLGVLNVAAVIDSTGSLPNTGNGAFTSTGSTSGQLRIRRVGSSVDVISRAGNNIATKVSSFYTSPVIVGLVYGSNFNTAAYSSAIRITNFRYVVGSTIVDEDGFLCNSVE